MKQKKKTLLGFLARELCCVAFKLEEEKVWICRERKCIIKLAVDKRHAIAKAHCRYCWTFYVVAAAIKLFIATDFLIWWRFLKSFKDQR